MERGSDVCHSQAGLMTSATDNPPFHFTGWEQRIPRLYTPQDGESVGFGSILDGKLLSCVVTRSLSLISSARRCQTASLGSVHIWHAFDKMLTSPQKYKLLTHFAK